MLRVDGLESSYGQTQVLWGISLDVQEGEVVALIGANGAGKTTCLKTCMSQVQAKAGQVLFNKRDITNKPTHEIVHLGMTMVPEGRHVFPDLTVGENLLLGSCGTSDRELARTSQEMVFQLFPRLLERRSQKAGTLSGGEQQMLALGRALICQPSMLLLDEPSLGLAPLLQDELFDQIQRINEEQGTSILLVEQNAFLALEVSDRGYVLQDGRIVAQGASRELREQSAIQESYLGGTVEDAT